MPDPEALPRRPLTLEELETLHASGEPGIDRIPGLPHPKPWALLVGVAVVCAALGFAIAALYRLLDPRVEHRLARSHLDVDLPLEARPPLVEPALALPALDDARALPERAAPTRRARATRRLPAPPEPVVVKRPAAASSESPPGYIEAEVDAESAREFERKHGPARSTP